MTKKALYKDDAIEMILMAVMGMTFVFALYIMLMLESIK